MNGKVNLKDNIFIEGFDCTSLLGFWGEQYQVNLDYKILYYGKTSEISEDVAKECVRHNHIVTSKTARLSGSGQTYKDYSGEAQWYIYSPIKSILSACSKPYCIIYKEK